MVMKCHYISFFSHITYLLPFSILRLEENMQAPPWMDSLLSSAFFSICPSHKATPRSECNMYCLDCKSESFCLYCRSSRHKDHQVIQIRRSSYHDVVRATEIQKVFDITGIQTYVINSARVIFLNERTQLKNNGGKGVSGSSSSHVVCEICGRSLLDPFRFCSLGCKLVGMKKSGDGDRWVRETKGGKVAERREGTIEEEEVAEERFDERRHLFRSNSRRRKGKPRRAPLGP